MKIATQGIAIMADKPASRPIAKALARRDKFAAQFALPGLVPATVQKDGQTMLFDTETEAENAAHRALFSLLTSRTVDRRWRNDYEVLSPAEFARYLAAAEITPTYFAEIYGTKQSRVMQWLDGEADIPHSAHVLVRLMAIPAALDLASEITNGRMSGND